jgi:hypothetical protein
MQERITRRVGRFVRLLAGRPPVVSNDARPPRDSDRVALRADSAVGPLAVGNTLAPPARSAVGPLAVGNALAPPASPAARPSAAAKTVAARRDPLALPPASANPRSAPRVTARPALRGRLTASAVLLGMLLLCLITCLVAAWRQLDVLAGLGFCASCVLAPVYARRSAQLRVAISAPVAFLVAEIIAQSLTAPGSFGHGAVLSILEGTLLALAAVAPWLFAGTAVCIVFAMFRGLPQCIRDLRTGPTARSAGRAGLGVPADAASRDQRS